MPSSPLFRRRPAAVAAALALILLSGCSDDDADGDRPTGENEHYIVQGNQLAQGDLRIGLISVSEEEAAMNVHADDSETETVRAGEGESFEVGRRTVTVERIDTGDDEGVSVTIDDPEATTSPQPSGSPSDQGAASSDNPMEDPEVFSVRVGHQTTESGVTFGLGAATGNTARMLVQSSEGEGEQVEAATGDTFPAGDTTVEVVDVGDGIAYLKFQE